MWKSKYRCYIIKNRYICTKDEVLSKVYALLKELSVHWNSNGSFLTLIREVIDVLETFAQRRGLTDKDHYKEVRRILTFSYDTLQLGDSEFENVRNMLMDCIDDMQRLEERADKVSPLAGASYEEEKLYDPKKNYRELRIRATHTTRDMSVSNTYDADFYIDIDPCEQQEDICLDVLDGGRINVLSVAEDAIALRWRGKDYYVKLGTELGTADYVVNNPRLSYDSLSLSFAYREIPNYFELWSMIANLGCEELAKATETLHMVSGDVPENAPRGSAELRDLLIRKNEILHFIDNAIEKGNTGLYVAKALLSASSNWGTCEISSIEYFQENLLKGIANGCLAPDNHFGWEWMEVAAKYNDASDFMEDTDLFYEVLNAAAGCGVVEAIDLMNSIWEPEQIIGG